MEASERRGPRYRVQLKVDGQVLPLKAFIHDLIGGSVMGMLDGLKADAEAEVGLVELRIETRRPDERSQPES